MHLGVHLVILKSLTLQGFKSFASRTVIELPTGIAAIVGPNGSGKSNISDAIRWVMGEQSIRVLRGSRLEDVIFAGSDTKKPVGMAEVTLTFDNSQGKIPLDYSEVTVQRRVFRSGDSEFLINKNVCRLKDIQELFMDTGLGRGGLAIIGQGEIETILSARPEERRAFLDEAAGIAKYRVRKREAIVKLQQTAESLDRVNDIIAEVEGRLQPLKQQADDAKQYQQLMSRLQHLESLLLEHEFHSISGSLEQAKLRLDAVSTDLAETTAQVEETERAIDELSSQLKDLDAQIEAARARKEAAQKEVLAIGHHLELQKQKLEQSEHESVERRRRIGEIQARIHRLEEERRAVSDRLKDAEQKRASATDRLRAITDEMAQADALDQADDEALKNARAQLVHMAEQIAAANSRIESLKANNKQLQETIEAVETRKAGLQQDAQSMEKIGTEIDEKLISMTSELDKMNSRVAALGRDIRQLRDERKAKEAQVFARRSKLQEVKARHSALSAMEAGREGYQRGVREVLISAPKYGWDLKGAVAELIQVDARFEHAIEIALGAAAQHVIAGSDVDAKNAIAFLKERKLGRVTFLPLNMIAPQPLAKRVLEEASAIRGVMGIAADLISFSPEVDKAIRYLLGRVIITEHIDSALALVRRVQGFSRAVSLEGDVVVPGGAITGGSRHQRSGDGLLGRTRQLAELAEVIRTHEAAVRSAEKDLELIDRKIGESTAQLAELEKQIRELERERLQCERDQKDHAAALKRNQEAMRACDVEKDRMQQELARHQGEIQKLMQSTVAMERQRDQLVASLADLERAQQARRGEGDELRRLAEEAKVEQARAEQEVLQLENDQKRLDQDIADALTAKQAEEAALTRSVEEQKQTKLDIEATEEKQLKAVQEEEAARVLVEELQARRAQSAPSIQQQTDRLKALRDQEQRLAQSQAQCRVDVERLTVKLEQVIIRFEERGLPYPPKERDDRASIDPPALRSEIKSITHELERLGPVNVHSINEYAEVKERYEFLTHQREDLERASARLQQVIDRIDDESGSKLLDVLAKVRKSFQETFSRLFGGGRADLSLTDPDHPLESGIDIFVQPPGKKMQNLLALSGGEKALSAVALLFALLDVSPIPFCVLDEVDAALDEQNLERFRSLLEEYAERTQFLIITHRQTTMEGSDKLFGVTMEEAGVSTLVALDLEEVKSA